MTAPSRPRGELVADLWALLRALPEDGALGRLLFDAVRALDPDTGDGGGLIKPGRERCQVLALQPFTLDELVDHVRDALDVAAIKVRVYELDGHGNRTQRCPHPLRRLVRCLRSAGLLDEGHAVPVHVLAMLADGRPIVEVADATGVDEHLVAAAERYVRCG